MRLICSVLGHKPDKTRVWNDNLDFRAPCVRCGAPMLRDERKDWRVFEEGRDSLPVRKQNRKDPRGTPDA